MAPGTANISWPATRGAPDILRGTGAWVALPDGDDRAHGRCAEALRGPLGRLLSTEAVLAEALRLAGGPRDGPRRWAEVVRRGILTLVPASAESLAWAVDLMARYGTVPMDYADATLVILGEDLGLDRVFTLDRRRFGGSRLHGRRPFQVIPRGTQLEVR